MRYYCITTLYLYITVSEYFIPHNLVTYLIVILIFNINI